MFSSQRGQKVLLNLFQYINKEFKWAVSEILRDTMVALLGTVFTIYFDEIVIEVRRSKSLILSFQEKQKLLNLF